ncbi:MAG: hypothetical protein K2X39_08470, partial [Silvanigrellaceae bacterium]|nr:hypothetical protein [Silvanigrellaceae bacterium]
VKNILVVPFQDLTNYNFFSYSFTSLNINNNSNKKTVNKILLSDNIENIFNTSINKKCKAFFINELFYVKNNKILNYYNSTENLKAYESFPGIAKNVFSILYNQFEPGIFCSSDEKNNFILLPKSLAKTKLNFEDLTINDSALRGQIFNFTKKNSNALFHFKNKQNLNFAVKLKNQKNDAFLETIAEIFAKMDLYQINIYNQLAKVDMQLLDEKSKAWFIELFGIDFYDELKNFIVQSLQQ